MAQEKWEYMTEFIRADVNGQGVMEYMSRRWPDFRPGRYSPETMVLALNKRGEVGWELVSMQPVCVGDNSDIGFPSGTGLTTWTHVYFCAFKRRIEE